jgi:hypothetical protein
VYNAAGIAVPPAVASLNLAVMRRDGRQFLHVTSLRPVDADHLHLYLELTDHGQRAVRLVTLWLTPDPAPAAPPMTAPAGPVLLPTVPAPRVERAAPAGAPAIVAPAPEAAIMPAPLRARVEAATPAPKHLPVRAAVTATSANADEAPSATHRPASRASIEPAPLRAHDPQSATCAGHGAEAQACAALGARNAELRARIGKLEARVDTLRASLGAAAMPAQTPAAARAAPDTDADAGKGHGAAKSQLHDSVEKAAPAPAHAPVAKEGIDDKAKAGAGNGSQESAGRDAEASPEAATEAKDHKEHKDGGDDKQAREPASPDAGAEASRPPAGPKPISSIKPLVPHKPKTPPADDGLPWGWIAGGLGALAGAGAIGALVVARFRKRGGAAPAEPGWLSGLRGRLRARGAGTAHVEPGAEAASAPVAPAGAE